MNELVEEIKTRLGLTGDYHDALIGSLAEDVKAFMLDGGISQEVIDSERAVGCIARGVADLWNYGSGDGHFSEVFFQRIIQLSMPETGDSPITGTIPEIDPIEPPEIDEVFEKIESEGGE